MKPKFQEQSLLSWDGRDFSIENATPVSDPIIAAHRSCRAELITVDPDVMAYTISSSFYEQAGVREEISMKTDYSYNVFQAGWRVMDVR